MEEIPANTNKNLLMTQLYNIKRSFFILRPDIPYNKSIIGLSYLFLINFKKEQNTFYNVVNLIYSNSLKYFIANENENETNNYYSLFDILLGKYLEKIKKLFSKQEITLQLYIVPWLEELFSRTLNIKLLFHIFNLY